MKKPVSLKIKITIPSFSIKKLSTKEGKKKKMKNSIPRAKRVSTHSLKEKIKEFGK